MRIKRDDEFVLTDKAIKREEFLKRISSLKWDNAEIVGLIFGSQIKDDTLDIPTKV